MDPPSSGEATHHRRSVLAGAVRAGDHRRCLDLLVDHGMALVLGGHEQLVADALDLLDDGQAGAGDAVPTALLGVAGMLHRARSDSERAAPVAGRAVRAARGLAARLQATGAAPDRGEAALLMDAASLHCWLARFRWAEVPDALAATALVLGEPLDGSAPSAPLRVTDGSDPTRLCLLLRETAALETWAGLLDRAAAHTGRALLTAEEIDNPRLRAAALADHCLDQVLRGELESAARTARRSLASADAAGRFRDGYLSRPHLALGLAALYALRLPEARAELEETRRVLARAPEPLVAGLALVLEVWLTAEAGDVVEARRLLADAPALPEAAPPLLSGSFAFVGSQLALLDGDLRAAQRHGEHLRDLGSDLGAGVVDAGLLEAGGRADAAVALLTELVDVRPRWGGEEVAAIIAEAALARLLAAGSQHEAARDRLRAAVTRAAPGCLAQPVLLGLGDAAPALLTRLQHEPGRAHPYADVLVRAIEARTAAPAPRLPGPRRDDTALALAGTPQHAVVAAADEVDDGVGPGAAAAAAKGVVYVPPLTPRELDVLRRLALGDSYADAADALHLSANTVKTHVASIYRKLGAERRSLALRRARELALI